MRKLLFWAAFMLLACQAAAEEWTYMPSGARPAYMGIHGGTMPVSLLASDDGASLFSFVGLTGNDFMEVLKKVHMPLPSFANATRKGAPLAQRRTGLFAGNSTASMPVFSLSGNIMTALDDLRPFGLSSEPLSIEGPVEKPEHFPHARSLRLSFLPDFFQPHRARSR